MLSSLKPVYSKTDLPRYEFHIFKLELEQDKENENVASFLVIWNS